MQTNNLDHFLLNGHQQSKMHHHYNPIVHPHPGASTKPICALQVSLRNAEHSSDPVFQRRAFPRLLDMKNALARKEPEDYMCGGYLSQVE